MYRLTDRRHNVAQETLQRYRHLLHENGFLDCHEFETELRELWQIGYQEVKDIFEDMLQRYPQ